MSVTEVMEVEEIEVAEVSEVKKERRPIDSDTLGELYETKEECEKNLPKYKDGGNVERGYYVYKVAKVTRDANDNVVSEANVCYLWAKNPIESLGFLAAAKGYEAEIADGRRRGRAPKSIPVYLVAIWPMIKAQNDKEVSKAFIAGILESFSQESVLTAFGEDVLQYV